MPFRPRDIPRRRDNRVLFPSLNLSIGDDRRSTLNWSYTGFLLFWPGVQPKRGEWIAGFLHPPPGTKDEETGAFDAVVVRADPIRNHVALAMHRGTAQTYDIFETALRRALRANR